MVNGMKTIRVVAAIICDDMKKPAAISGKVSNEKQEVEVKGTGNYKDSLFLYLCVDKGLINVEFTDAGKSKYKPSDPTGEKDKTIELQSDKLYCTGQPFTLSDFDVRCDGVEAQAARLRADGIEVKDGKVDLNKYQYR